MGRKVKLVYFNEDKDKELLRFADNQKNFSIWVKEQIKKDLDNTENTIDPKLEALVKGLVGDLLEDLVEDLVKDLIADETLVGELVNRLIEKKFADLLAANNRFITNLGAGEPGDLDKQSKLNDMDKSKILKDIDDFF